MTIRLAARADLDAIASLLGPSTWKPADFLAHNCRVAVVDERVAGFLVSREVAPGEREILYLAVDPPYRRRGIARELLRDELARSGRAWFLEVRESNVAAIKLYESAGFRHAGRRPQYYSAPLETAIVMRFFS